MQITPIEMLICSVFLFETGTQFPDQQYRLHNRFIYASIKIVQYTGYSGCNISNNLVQETNVITYIVPNFDFKWLNLSRSCCVQLAKLNFSQNLRNSALALS